MDPTSEHAARIGELLAASGDSLALAESCTGGRLAAALTAVPGASRWLWGGAVVYSAAAKSSLLGVDEDLLARHGTVSAATTAALARAVRERSGATWGLAVTGWAGPDGGTARDPVGTVYMALTGAGTAATRRCRFPGDRAGVQDAAVSAALAWLRAVLEGGEEAPGEPVGGIGS